MVSQTKINNIEFLVCFEKLFSNNIKPISGIKYIRFCQCFYIIVYCIWRNLSSIGNKIIRNAFDGHGNYSLGITEQIIFPEIDYDKIERISGMNIAIVTTAKNDEQGFALLKALGMPFAK